MVVLTKSLALFFSTLFWAFILGRLYRIRMAWNENPDLTNDFMRWDRVDRDWVLVDHRQRSSSWVVYNFTICTGLSRLTFMGWISVDRKGTPNMIPQTIKIGGITLIHSKKCLGRDQIVFLENNPKNARSCCMFSSSKINPKREKKVKTTSEHLKNSENLWCKKSLWKRPTHRKVDFLVSGGHLLTSISTGRIRRCTDVRCYNMLAPWVAWWNSSMSPLRFVKWIGWEGSIESCDLLVLHEWVWNYLIFKLFDILVAKYCYGKIWKM